MEIEKIRFPEDFGRETVKGTDACRWSNAQVLDALNKTVSLLKAAGANAESAAEKNYQVITNEIRRRLQANVENLVLLEVERYYNIDRESGQIENEDDMPGKYDSESSACCALETLADGDDDIVFIGIHYADYMKAWNRMVDRKKNHIFFYDDENDEEKLFL